MLALREELGEPVWDEHARASRPRARLTREEAAVARGTRTVPVGAVEDADASRACPRAATSRAEPGERPTLLYFHGGGFVVGDLDTHDAPCRVLCRHAGVRRAQRRVPQGARAPVPGVRRGRARAAFAMGERRATTRVAVGGDSAGGNLAATLAIEYDPALALLIYPAVDATQRAAVAQAVRQGLLPHRRADDWYTGHFMPRGRRSRRPAALAAAAPGPGGLRARAGRHRRLRPAARRGRGLRARRCARRGVRVLAHRFRGLFHGFINSIGASPSSYAALVEVAGMPRALLRAG